VFDDAEFTYSAIEPSLRPCLCAGLQSDVILQVMQVDADRDLSLCCPGRQVGVAGIEERIKTIDPFKKISGGYMGEMNLGRGYNNSRGLRIHSHEHPAVISGWFPTIISS